MLSQSEIELLRPKINQLKIIIAALIAGVVFFALVVVVMGVSFQAKLEILSTIGIGLGIMSAVMSLIAPKLIVKSTILQYTQKAKDLTVGDKDKMVLEFLMQAWMARSIVGAALLEGGAFLNAVVAMIERNAINLVVAIFLLALMVIYFPFENRVIDWIESHKGEL